MNGVHSRNGFTLVEALVAVAILSIALAPILSTARRILAASQREERRAMLAEIAESRLSEAAARLESRRAADLAAPERSGAKGLPSGWRDSGSDAGAFWTLHARPLAMAESVQRWRIDSTARDPDGLAASSFREMLVPSPAAQ